jgi:hypothetical protein
LVSPILVDGNAPKIKEWYANYYDDSSVKKSQELAGYLRVVAEETGCEFIDAATVARAGEDGIHFDVASHRALGTVVAKQIVP